MKRAVFGKTILTSVKANVTAGVAALALTVSMPAAALADTLADAMADAYKNSGLLEQNRAVLRAADEDVAVAVSALRPVLTWAYTVTHSFGQSRSASTGGAAVGFTNNDVTLALAAEQLLWDNGRSKKQIEAAKEAVLSTRQALVSIEQAVLLQAVDAYTRVRTAAETVALRENNVRVIIEELRAAKDRFEVGEVTRTDVAQAEARLAQARAAQAQAQGDLVSAQEYFLAAVGRRAGRLASPPTAPMTAKSAAEAKAVAQRTHPDVLKAKHDVAAADLAVAISEAAMKPTVALKGRYGLTETFDSTNFSHAGSVSVEASGPIYMGGRLSASLRQAMARRDVARSALHLTSVSVAQNAGTAFANLQVARAAREAGDRQVRFARVAFRGVREEATLGARTTLDVLNAEQELLNAQASLITAVANEYLASYSLLSSMGLLTAQHLRLGVPRYDPAAYYKQVKDAPALKSEQGKKLDKMLRRIGKE